MKQIQKIHNRLRGFTEAFFRFPLTSVFLLAATVLNAVDINTTRDNYSKYLITLVVGAFLGTVVQTIYERYFANNSGRIILMAIASLLTIGYYFIILPVPRLSIEIGVRTLVALFALLIAFIWVPVIKSKTSFNESFMASFKAFFISIFFAGVIFAGVSIIISAVDQLLFSVDEKFFLHTANIVFILFAPMFFLSLVPVYLGKRDQNKEKDSMLLNENQLALYTNCPKYLQILISYIIIPLTIVFTLILILYILQNISNQFWSNNLLEPMIVAYSITIILVYILASRIENRLTVLFRKVLPKVLVPVVVVQIIASIMKIGDMGITYDRYYVILYGIFAVAAGVVFSIMPVQKNGIIAALLIVFSVISVIPPVDAFTISRNSQMNQLERILAQNSMIEDNSIKPNPSISEQDKQKIIDSMNYLSRMEYTDNVSWLPENFDYYSDFYKTFGFYSYGQVEGDKQYVYLNLPQNFSVNIGDYEYLFSTNFSFIKGETINEDIGIIETDAGAYTLTKDISQELAVIRLNDKNMEELLSFQLNQVFNRYVDYDSEKGMLSLEEATFTEENDMAAIKVIVRNINLEKSSEQTYYGADIYILVNIK